MEKYRVLFLCTGNSARSQMAEAYLRKYAGSTFDVHSAGLEPKGINPLTVRVMEDAGFDMSGHWSKGVDDFLGKVHFHFLITLCDDAEKNCPTAWPGVNQRLHWSFEDPGAFEASDEERLKKFRQVRDLISARIRSWLNENKIPISS
jgi:arsenate reductase (thioredoxin)